MKMVECRVESGNLVLCRNNDKGPWYFTYEASTGKLQGGTKFAMCKSRCPLALGPRFGNKCPAMDWYNNGESDVINEWNMPGLSFNTNTNINL